MPLCANCGTNNLEGVRFCVACGSQVGEAPPAESWRASSDLGGSAPPSATADPADTGTGAADSPGYTPQVPPPPPSYPAYTPQQAGTPYYQQQQPAPAAQPMHPAVPAIVSLILPGIGLLFVPNKAGLGLGVFAAFIVYGIIATILTFVFVGICLFVAMPIINVAAAIHSWDEAAKSSGGQFQPILFK
jgi:hypothetical protein